MHQLPISISLFILSAGASLAEVAAPTLPGFDIGSRSDSAASSLDLNPAATFSHAMKGAFLTPDGIKLQVAPGNVLIHNWGGSPNAPRRVRAVIGHPSTSNVGRSSGNGAELPASGVVGNAPSAIPEPGTVLVGLSLLGFCAGLRPRGSCRR